MSVFLVFVISATCSGLYSILVNLCLSRGLNVADKSANKDNTALTQTSLIAYRPLFDQIWETGSEQDGENRW